MRRFGWFRFVSVKFSIISWSSSLQFSSLSVDGIDPSKKESENWK